MRTQYAIACLLYTLCAPALAQTDETALRALHTAKALNCEFETRVETSFQGDALRPHQISDKTVLMFDSIEYPRPRACLVANYRHLGPSANEVDVFWSASGITLVEGKDYRNHSFTTVFPVFVRSKTTFAAVHSVHALDPKLSEPNGPAQSYGTCRFSP